ncbi:MAG TPA: cell division protein FtsE, partial [Citreicella sp.]|nr:cell division protein FtsE [Citreicella sp.]
MIELDQVGYSYGGGELLTDLTLQLAAGSFH